MSLWAKSSHSAPVDQMSALQPLAVIRQASRLCILAAQKEWAWAKTLARKATKAGPD